MARVCDVRAATLGPRATPPPTPTPTPTPPPTPPPPPNATPTPPHPLRPPHLHRLPRQLVRPLIHRHPRVPLHINQPRLRPLREERLRPRDELLIHLRLPPLRQHADRILAVRMNQDPRRIRRNRLERPQNPGQLGHVVRRRPEELVPLLHLPARVNHDEPRPRRPRVPRARAVRVRDPSASHARRLRARGLVEPLRRGGARGRVAVSGFRRGLAGGDDVAIREERLSRHPAQIPDRRAVGARVIGAVPDLHAPPLRDEAPVRVACALITRCPRRSATVQGMEAGPYTTPERKCSGAAGSSVRGRPPMRYGSARCRAKPPAPSSS